MRSTTDNFAIGAVKALALIVVSYTAGFFFMAGAVGFWKLAA